ncbi:PREDICTED: vacuolar iron transporter homolog 4-like [Ipomoea nil]|uniref:vacuolar iron transporter homolog 4-like n=1 Tax=Ipomoea nil TaxID=35883 RepID=UPI000901C6C4|nr:PREDICTED: vacuolar iron transporter homolog 4-like [Ipomoea nil]
MLFYIDGHNSNKVSVYVDFYTLPFSPCYIYPLLGRLCSHQAIYLLLYSCVDLFAFSYYTHSFYFMDAQIQIPIPKDAAIQNQCQEPQEKEVDYAQRAQWLRAAVLGANDGLVSIASLMMGIGAVKKDVRAMFLAGFAGLVAGACSMAIGEFVSVYSQLDIEVAQMKRDKRVQQNVEESDDSEKEEKENLPNPIQAALASALAFSFGAMVPLMAAAFIANHKLRLVVVICAVSLALVVFGVIGAVLGKTPVVKSCARVLIGGWMAMAVTFGLTKLVNSAGLEM